MDRVQWRGLHALSPGLVDVVGALVERCERCDGAPARVHWPLASKLRTGLVHRLAVLDGELIAYGCAYRFDPEEAEVVMAVDPDHRRRGLGRALAAELGAMVRGWGAPSWLGYVPSGARSPRPPTWLTGKVLRIERAMVCRALRPGAASAPESGTEQLRLREAGFDDFDLLARLDAESFGSDPELVRERMHGHLDGIHRRAFVARLGADPVGKIHLRDDGEAVFVHDLCIRPQHRGLGLGAAMVAAATARALDWRGEARLEVEAPNEAAVRLYTAVGYEVRAAWSVRRFVAAPSPVRE